MRMTLRGYGTWKSWTLAFSRKLRLSYYPANKLFLNGAKMSFMVMLLKSIFTVDKFYGNVISQKKTLAF